MRAILMVGLACLWMATAHAGWQEVTISADFYGAQAVYAADLDGDGDVDLLGAALYGDEIAWWENTDGYGLAWTMHTVDGEVSHPTSVYAADVDGDGDMDILGTSYYEDTITWWENLDGTGLNWSEHTVGSAFNCPWCVHADDLDGDGDVDVLGAAYHGDAITWWENVDGSGLSWTEHPIDTMFEGALSVYSADVDGDGDVDVLGGAAFHGDITWWENLDGVGQTWSEHSVNGLFGNPWDVYAADMDGDGDVDVLGCDTYEGDIVWCENRDGTGLLWSGHNVSNTSDGVHSIQAADVDGDGDMDVLGAAGEIAWWENLGGTGQYWVEHTINRTYGYKAVYVTDVDGDNDIDVLGTAEFDNVIALCLQEGPHEPEPVVVLISPVTPTVVPQGGSFVYDFRLRVNYQQPFNGYLWTTIKLPNDQYFGPIFSTPIQFSPGMQISVPGVQQQVPEITPEGYYDWIVNAGPTPFMAVGTDSFPVRVIAGNTADVGGQVSDKHMVPVQKTAEWSTDGESRIYAAVDEWLAGNGYAVVADVQALPSDYSISAAYPNPFNAKTSVAVDLPHSSQLTVSVYNMTGQQVANLMEGVHPAGEYRLAFDGSDLATGLYFIRATVPGQMDQVRKVVLLK